MQQSQLVAPATLSLVQGVSSAAKPANPADKLRPAKPTSPEAITLRRGLFVAASRTYGESYIEPISRHVLSLEKPIGGDHDGRDAKTDQRYEIKSAKVLGPNPSNRKPKKDERRSLFDEIEVQAQAVPLARVISFTNRKTARYDANIQNVKRDHFDHLVFVLLFEEGIEIFKTPTSRVNRKHIANWSDKHGRYDELGKSGQFSVKSNNIEAHERASFTRFITYEELVPVVKQVQAS